MNSNPWSETSDWALTDVVIWDRLLSYTDMKKVSDNMLNGLCGPGNYWKDGTTGCSACPSGSITTGSSCQCAGNSYWSRLSNICIPCPSGSVSSNSSLVCVCATPNYIMNGTACVPYYTYGVSGAAPWGIYRASDYLSFNKKLVEAQGNGRDVNTVGTITMRSGSGNGAVGNITSISGGTTATMLWPMGPSGSAFTICAITRYVAGGTNRRILQDNFDSFWLGHYNGLRGVALYVGWVKSGSSGTLTNWLVMCGQNSGEFPNNLISDGKFISFLLI